jgi:hypothetical protein
MLCVFAYAGPWQYAETDIFQPIRSVDVAVHPDGSIYIRNFQDAEVHHVSKEGKLIKKIGGKGKGPGEFTYPRFIRFAEGKLYVYDLLNAQISVFEEDGTFIERIETPDRGIALAKGNGGWLYGTWSTFSGPPGDPNATADLVWVDEKFGNNKTVIEAMPKGQGQGSMMFSDGTNTNAIYSPITAQAQMVSTDSHAYISHPTEAKIYVFDFEAQKLLDPIVFDYKPIPFDTDWANEQFLASREGSRPGEPPLGDWKKMYPDTFPAIRDLMVDPDGNLVIDRWRGRPDDNHYLLTLTPKGEVLPNKYEYDFLERYLGQSQDGFVYISIFNEDEEMAGVARVKKADAQKFAAENPINFDGSSGYSINISN